MSKYLNIHPNKTYLKTSLLFFVAWLFCTGPLRNFDTPESLFLKILIGSAPNFFAGITLVLWQIYITSTKPLTAFFITFFILILAEVVQLFMDNQTTDLYDIAFSFIGCMVGFFIAKLISRGIKKAS